MISPEQMTGPVFVTVSFDIKKKDLIWYSFNVGMIQHCSEEGTAQVNLRTKNNANKREGKGWLEKRQMEP